ncbi:MULTISPECIES: FliI/YscN family ATPase [unclassified Luteimonas]|uniref:FliI/YscN family ATPase n=1 Tax=unclassified Luteimonas TaxID=2629088 RepID=UPI0018F0BA20|nr:MULTISPECIES: FliI/YscN family ATPase [unclassified Luteimonas]MBJ6979132.1 FliI/YscN family ATPase [Luteimonas sp. MC1895]MBJ6985148.1 FliI/YscN family ATPase [Luteimonas sp. MC1750]QQO05804.1 FliI/YscN family ATPase [Luteimonas sp. MC1750]
MKATAPAAFSEAAGSPDPLLHALARVQSIERVGRVAEAYGTLIRATGLKAAIGELCELRNPRGEGDPSFRLAAEVVGVSKQLTLLTPLGALDGVSATTEVYASGRQAAVRVGPGLLGRILDAHGEPIDDLGPVGPTVDAPIYAASPNPLARNLIERPFSTGVRAIDTTMTAGEGQRIGIFAVAGGGKSTLLGMLARGGDADVNVIVLVGERGREVNEFIHDNLGPEGLARSVIVVATSDRPALERSRAAWVGTAIAEHFRDQGRRVLLLVDSVTRFARALRDVGLAVGEPPARRGFPPSVFSALPRLFERAGNNDKGSITAFYTVLAEDEDGGDPIVEEVRSILDGHIVLSRKLAAAYHYPAIDVLVSLSRTMPRVVDHPHVRAAGQLRKLLAKYQDIELLIQLGEYKRGTDPDADAAIEKIGAIRRLLQQSAQELVPFEQSAAALKALFP